MLRAEVVMRPLLESPSPVWRLGYSSKFLGSMGKKLVIRTIALNLNDLTDPVECVVWTNEESMADGLTYFVYLIFDPDSESTEALKRISRDLDPTGMLTQSTLPDQALPELKRTRDGKLLRLWPSPGPKVPESQKVRFEGETFRMANRVFEIR